ncbi:MAG: hypothetical protein OEY59_10960 [Deltaproteobacteria bacterium]|nr:hypothetical protein [Deltaproteobacteria bacterium]
MFRFIQIIGDQTAGFILGLLVVFVLALGSLVMNLAPEVYPPFFMLEFDFFFNTIKPIHFWFYILLGIFILFGFNLLFGTIESLIILIHTNILFKKRIAGLLFHLGLLLGLIAHLVEGYWGSQEQLFIGSEIKQIQNIGAVSVGFMKKILHPDGSTKDTKAILKIFSSENDFIEKTVSYNEPAIFDFGMREILLLHGKKRIKHIKLKNSASNKVIAFEVKKPVKVMDGYLVLMGVMSKRMKSPFGLFYWYPPKDKPQRLFIALDLNNIDYNHLTIKNQNFDFDSYQQEDSIMAQIRYNPSLYIMVASLISILCGSLFMLRIR